VSVPLFALRWFEAFLDWLGAALRPLQTLDDRVLGRPPALTARDLRDIMNLPDIVPGTWDDLTPDVRAALRDYISKGFGRHGRRVREREVGRIVELGPQGVRLWLSSLPQAVAMAELNTVGGTAYSAPVDLGYAAVLHEMRRSAKSAKPGRRGAADNAPSKGDEPPGSGESH
jgi:hypothetical protein